MAVSHSRGAFEATHQGGMGLAREPTAEGAYAQPSAELLNERRARAEAERAMRLRDEMLALVVHDLRNPLNTISLAAQLLIQGGLDANARRAHARTIERCARGMAHLIDDLLDVSSIEAGAFRIRRARVEIDMLLARLRSDFAVRAADAEVRLRCIAHPDLPAIRADGQRLYQVLSNLVGNALKVVRVGGHIDVEAWRAGDQVQIDVRDDGRGMEPDVMHHVFDRFWHADKAGRAGSGLGLYICKGIIEAHGGQIEVESAPGAGTAFHVRLPIS